MRKQTWTIAEWYEALTKKEDQKLLVFAGDWTIYPREEERMELIRHDGTMVYAQVEEDGVCRVWGDDSAIPIPDEVVDKLRELLNLV